MNIGKGRAKANIEKLAGTHRQVGKNLRDMELGGHEAVLYKVYTNQFYSNGWICVLKDTGEEVGAFNTFEPCERFLQFGESGQGVINFKPSIEVLLLQDRNGDEWHIIRSLDKKDIVVEPGERVFESPSGQSRFSIKDGSIKLDSPSVVINNYNLDNIVNSINVKDYGAIGDGNTDDTIAIQLAFDSITTKRAVYFPPGIYKITNTITVSNKSGLSIIGDNATLITKTTNLQYVFSINKCQNLKISNIEFNMDSNGKGAVSIVESPDSTVDNCYFHDCKYDVGEGYKSMIFLSYSPNTIVRNNTFKNIAENSQPAQNPQYRCVTVESGCMDLKVENNVFRDICQDLVVFEQPTWEEGVSYDTSTYMHQIVNYEVSGVIKQYRCVQAHTSTSEITPLNIEYWELLHENLHPTTKVLFKGNSTYNSRMNGIYCLREVKDIHILDNHWENITTMQTLTIVGKNAIITGNTFINNLNPVNVRNEADVEKIVITNNTFHGYNSHTWSLYVMTGMDSSGFKLKNLIFTNNIVISESTTDYTQLLTTNIVDKIIITGNIFKALAHSELDIGATTTLNVENNIFDTGAGSNQPIIRLRGMSNSALVASNQFKTAGSTTYYYNMASSVVNFLNNVANGVLLGGGIRKMGVVTTGAVTAGVDGTIDITVDASASFYEIVPWIVGGGTGTVVVSSRSGATFTLKYRFNNDWSSRQICWAWIKV